MDWDGNTTLTAKECQANRYDRRFIAQQIVTFLLLLVLGWDTLRIFIGQRGTLDVVCCLHGGKR